MLLNTPTEKTLFSPRIFWRMVKRAIAFGFLSSQGNGGDHFPLVILKGKIEGG
ncbi:hypothetical protein [Cylindrospermopsis raciborskii]|uniref:hypothetical protein n=1 Tax=Cylindrospermopsis raciborskii TaxID=77022 RepID=UPI0013663A1E|nr:hypothetical protein [Cylindrospermopsis raciborskii]